MFSALRAPLGSLQPVRLWLLRCARPAAGLRAAIKQPHLCRASHDEGQLAPTNSLENSHSRPSPNVLRLQLRSPLGISSEEGRAVTGLARPRPLPAEAPRGRPAPASPAPAALGPLPPCGSGCSSACCCCKKRCHTVSRLPDGSLRFARRRGLHFPQSRLRDRSGSHQGRGRWRGSRRRWAEAEGRRVARIVCGQPVAEALRRKCGFEFWGEAFAAAPAAPAARCLWAKMFKSASSPVWRLRRGQRCTWDSAGRGARI